MDIFYNIDPRLPPVLTKLCALCLESFGSALTGVYVHGSVAFGDFFWDSSDLDLLAVTNCPPDQAQKEAFLQGVLALDPALPPKGLEFSLLLAADCRRFSHPMPYLLHFSNNHKTRCLADLPGFAAAMEGRDPDLAGHIKVLLSVGHTLWGLPLEEVFTPPSQDAYLDSILEDLAGSAGRLEELPVYGLLNLCRTLAFVREGLILSKLQGGRWALSQAPLNFRPLIMEALDCQKTGRPFSLPLLPDLGPWFLKEIRSALE